MKSATLKKAIFCTLIAAAAACGANDRAMDSWSRVDAQKLLKRWADGLIACQVYDKARPELKGAILCPACALMHGRICDVVLPFTYLWDATGDRKYLDSAVAAIDWCEKNLIDAQYSLYINDRRTMWRCTTAFFQHGLAKVLLRYGDKLPPDIHMEWDRIFRRVSHALYRYFDDPGEKSVLNYYAMMTECMAYAWKILGDAKFADAARTHARRVKTLFLDDGLIAGEGPRPLIGKAPGGCPYVDIGYNCEETLPALFEYTHIMEDKDMAGLALKAARAHCAFILPDGGLDNSMGSRSAKWTYYGSRTSDGILPLLAALAPHEPYAVRAVARTLDLYRRCTLADGLLAGGLMHAEAGEPACVHHAFAHAKSLAELILSDMPEKAPAAPLPREIAPHAESFPSIKTHLAAIGPWRASFTANDGWNVSANAAIGGGSMSLLWHEALGPVCAATMARFRYVEPLNMQDPRHDTVIRCLTPRIESEGDSNVMDRFADASFSFADGVAKYSANGELSDSGRRKGKPFSLDYSLNSDGLCVKVFSKAAGLYHIPVIALPTDKVEMDGCKASIRRGNHVIRLEADKPFALEETEFGNGFTFTPIGGFTAACLYLNLPAGETVGVRLSVAPAVP